MADRSKLQQKDIKLNLTGVRNKAAVKELVGEFVIDNIRAMTRDQTSPVTGRRFRELKRKPGTYRDAKRRLVGNTRANLRLSGNMMDSLDHAPTREGVAVGIFKGGSRMKDQANGHNWIDGRRGPKGLARRQFIADNDEDFHSSIQTRLNDLVDSFKLPPDILETREFERETIDLADILDEDFEPLTVPREISPDLEDVFTSFMEDLFRGS